MIKYKFSTELNKAFVQDLKTKVNSYFQENDIGRNANAEMVTKSVLALSMFLVPYGIIMLGGFTSLPLLFFLWAMMGFGMAFIGLCIMHDALHGSYSRKKSVNTLMGICTVLIGVDAKIWQIQHNVLHHTYTNIEHADEDIQPRFVLRFSPHQPRKWFHRYQHIYAVFFYGISTIIWVFAKDYIKLFQYRAKGLVKKGTEFNKHLAFMLFRKFFYYFFILVLPIMVLNVSPWTVFLMFVTLHFVAGICLTMVFQPAHVIDTSDFILQEEEQIDVNWYVHQLYTTSNFAMDNKLLSWFVGGLNFQVEHHMFPNICHVHYRDISKILQNAVKEFELPYYAQKTFTSAILGHFKTLRALGRGDTY